MDFFVFIKALFSLLFVVGLVFLCSYLYRRLSISDLINKKISQDRRLSVSEVLYIDSKRKALLLKRDEAEHLILLSQNSEVLVESNISSKKQIKK